MIAFPSEVRVWLAGGVTDMRRGMHSLGLQVQEGLGRELYGQRSERKSRLLDQLELQLEEWESAASEAEV